MKSNRRTTHYSSHGGSMFILFVTLLILKLTETIDWSWWIITLPLWIGLVITLIIIIIVLIIVVIAAIVSAIVNK